MNADPISRAELAAQECRSAVREAHEALKDLRQTLSNVWDQQAQVERAVKRGVDDQVDARLSVLMSEMYQRLPDLTQKVLKEWVKETGQLLETKLVERAAQDLARELNDRLREAVAERVEQRFQRAELGAARLRDKLEELGVDVAAVVKEEGEE